MINIQDNWSERAIASQAAYVEGLIAGALRKKPTVGRLARAFLRGHSRLIAAGRPHELRRLIESADVLKSAVSSVEYTAFRLDCAAVLDYEAFSRRPIPNWGAYALCAESKYSMCPYCHQSFAHTLVRDAGGGFRPTLDHYYPKSNYPFLSLSIFNLIPSCYTCNSQLKGIKDFYLDQHVHPFEAADGAIEITIDLSDYLDGRVRGLDKLRFEIKSSLAHGKRSIETFALNRRFAVNSAYLDSFIARVMAYVTHQDARASVSQGLKFQLSESDLLGFNAGNYKDEMLGKIKKDLYDLVLSR